MIYSHSVCVFSILFSFCSSLFCVWVPDFVFSFIQNAPLLKSRSAALIHYNNLFNSSLMHYCLLGWDAIYSSSSRSLSFSFAPFVWTCRYFLLVFIFVPSNYIVQTENIQLSHKPKKIWFTSISTRRLFKKLYNRSNAEKSPICIVIRI